MGTSQSNPQQVQKWLAACLPDAPVTLGRVRNLRNGKEREVWDCGFDVGGIQAVAVLAIFKPGSLESVNTSLPPVHTARKCALAMTEVPPLGILTPRLLGHAEVGREAAVVSGRIEPTEWEPRVRIQAAGVLARIHSLEESSLSEPLRRLTRISDPREQRTTGWHNPKPTIRTLVHGDYFSANILPVAGGLCVIDWETFGWGDPMWDLGFLIGADRDLQNEDVEAAIEEYASRAPVDRDRLMWHRRRWADFWGQRER